MSYEVRAEARPDATFPMVQETPQAYVGSVVIWGGEILGTRNRSDGSTTLTVLEMPLEAGEQPVEREMSRGRFLAVTSRYLDPAVYRRGTRITVAGRIAGEESRPVGGMRYRYPVVDILGIHIWKKGVVYYGPPYYGGPYWHPGWRGPGPRWDEYWYSVPGG